jgi:hypothetical protein
MNKTEINKLISSYNYEIDNEGQILFYTGWYQHNDGTIHETPEGEE